MFLEPVLRKGRPSLRRSYRQVLGGRARTLGFASGGRYATAVLAPAAASLVFYQHCRFRAPAAASLVFYQHCRFLRQPKLAWRFLLARASVSPSQPRPFLLADHKASLGFL